MEQLIKLRHSLDKLDHSEWIQFKNTWISMLDRDVISSSIYHYFKYNQENISSNNMRQQYNLETVYESVTNILKSRNSKSRSNSQSLSQSKSRSQSLSASSTASSESDENYLVLNKLPFAIIGDIASYLKFQDYTNFEKVCRQTYISCNNPSTLYQLDLISICTQKPINYLVNSLDYNIRNKYSLIEELNVSVKYLTEYMKNIRNESKYSNKLKSLRLFNCYSMNTLNEFIENNNLINYQSITNLTCDYFVNVITALGVRIVQHFDSYQFYSFLKRFNQLNTLRLVNVYTTDTHNDDDHIISELFPNLTHFSVMHSESILINRIITLYGHQLQQLQIFNEDMNNNIISIPNQGFPNLESLSFAPPPIHYIYRMLDKVKKLKRIGIALNYNQNMSSLDFEALIVTLIKTQPLLEYLGFDIKIDQLPNYMNALRTALSQTWNIHKRKLKIGIHVHDCNVSIIKYAQLYMTQIMNKLKRSNIENYMLFMKWFHTENYEDQNEQQSIVDLNKMLRTLNLNYSAFYELRNENPRNQLFVISNNDCTINGFGDGWKSLARSQ